eukprot:symbB.v1.2.005935.t1/scaffold346.1/size246720/4
MEATLFHKKQRRSTRPYLKSLPVSQCIPHGREGVRSTGTHWRSFAAALWANLGSVSRHGWRRFLGQALSHHLCRDQPPQVCSANAEFCPLGCLSAHLTLLLSAPNAYPLDDGDLFSPSKVPSHLWERLGVGLGYFLWNPTGFKLLDLLYSGWPIFGLLRQLRGPLSRIRSGEAVEFDHIHRLRRRSERHPSSHGENMAHIVCVFQPKRHEDNHQSCAVLEVEHALKRAEEWLAEHKDSIWQSREKHEVFEEIMATADKQLRRMLSWFQADGDFQVPGARLAAGLLIAGDAVLPRLERLQRYVRRAATMPLQAPSEWSLCSNELQEQGALVAEASYVQRLFRQLERPTFLARPFLQPRETREAWVTFLWGGHGKVEDSAWIYGEAIRTLAHSVRKMGKDWSHGGATPLAEVDVNASYTGTVTNVGQYGVFVNFGAVKDGLLKVPSKFGRRLQKGMQIEDLTIASLDPDNGKVLMEVDEAQLQNLEPKPRRPSSRGRSPAPKGGARSRQRSRPKRTWDHQGATALEELQLGDVFEGTVTNVSVYGVFVDVGAVRDARLNVPAVIGRRFRIGDTVQDCTIETIDLEQQRMSVTLPDPEAAVEGLPPKDPKEAKEKAPKSKAAPKAKGKAKAKAKPKAASQSRRKTESGAELEDLQEGDVFEGTVTNVGRYGVFVDVGAVKDARLSVPASECIIDKLDLEQQRMSVALPEEVPKAKAKSAPKASAKGKAKAQVKAKAKAASVGITQRARSPAEVQRGPASAKAKARASSVPRSTGMSNATPARAQPKRAASAAPTARAQTTAGARAAAPSRTTNAAPVQRTAAPKQRAANAPSKTNGGVPIEKLHVGKAVDGIVTNNNQYGVFVNIGCAKDARLNVSRQMAKEFRKGDEIYGMTIETVDVEKNQISCSLEDPELFVEEEQAAPPRRKK